MPERVQVRDPLDRLAQLAPAARPVDTFVPAAVQRPAASNPLQGLAEALGVLAPKVSAIEEERRKKETKEAIAEGERLQRENRVAFKDAVQRGVIPAGANPWVEHGYRSAELRLKGMDFQNTLHQAWAASAVRNSNDPAAYEQFVTKFTADYMQQNLKDFSTLEVSESFAPSIEKAQTSLRAAHTAYRVQENERIAVESAGRLMVGHLDGLASGALGGKAGAERMADFGKRLETEGAALTATGISNATVSETMLNSIVATAVRRGDVALLDVANHITTGTGKLGGTAVARKVLDTARQQILTRQNTIENQAHTRKQRAKAEKAEAVAGLAFDAILKDNRADLGPFLTALRSAGSQGLSAAGSILSLQKTIQDRQYQEDPDAKNALLADIYRGKAGMIEVLSALAAKAINPDTARAFQAEVKERDDKGSKYIGAEDAVRKFGSNLERVVRGSDFAPFDQALEVAANTAYGEYVSRLRQWRKANPEADITDVARQVADDLQWKYADIVTLSTMLDAGRTPPKGFDVQSRYSDEAIHRHAARSPERLLKVRREFLEGRALWSSAKELSALAKEYNAIPKDALKKREAHILFLLSQRFGFPDHNAFLREQYRLIQSKQ